MFETGLHYTALIWLGTPYEDQAGSQLTYLTMSDSEFVIKGVFQRSYKNIILK